MSKVNRALAALGLASAMMLAGPAFAQDQGWYVGGTIGQSKAKDGCDGVIGSCDSKDMTWRILGGYQFNKHLAVELGHSDLGEVAGVDSGVNFTVNSKVWEVVAVGSFPFANSLAAYGKLGMYRGDTEAVFTGGSLDDSNTAVTYAFGLRWDFTKNLGARFEYQVYKDVGGSNVGESDATVLSAGVIWKF